MSRCAVSIFLTLSFSISLSTGPADAQTPNSNDNTITVTGQKLEKKEAKRQSRSFVGQTTHTSFSQYARRNRPVCPRVIGIDSSYAQFVESKIRIIAKAAQVKVEDGECEPNLFVLFTSDSNSLMTALRKAKPSLFDSVKISERRALYTDQSPVRWWHSTTFTGASGAEKKVASQNTDSIETRGFNSSLIDTQFVINLAGSIVVVDISKSTGYPLESIAAYAAMVSFAEVKPEKSHSALPSILAIFGEGKNPGDAPRDLTAFDYAYVASLYEIQPNRAGNVQKSLIASKMAAKLSQ